MFSKYIIYSANILILFFSWECFGVRTLDIETVPFIEPELASL